MSGEVDLRRTLHEIRQGWSLKWLFRGYIARGSVTIFYGHGETFKSTLCRTLAMSALTGRTILPSFQPTTTPEDGAGAALFMSEDPRHYAVQQLDRIGHAANAPGYGPEKEIERGSLPFIFGLGDEKPLLFFDQAGPLIKHVNGDWQSSDLLSAVWDTCPDLIVIDPLINFFVGNESDSLDAALFMSAMNSIASSTGAAVVVVTHAAKSLPGAPIEIRGSSVFRNEARAVFAFERKGDNVLFTCRKMNLARRPAPVEFRINEAGLLEEVTVNRGDLEAAVVSWFAANPESMVTLGGLRTSQGSDAQELIAAVRGQHPDANKRHITEATSGALTRGLLTEKTVTTGKGSKKKILRVSEVAL